MVTRRHLAVIRVAIQYFREELGPHGAAAFQPYRDGPVSEAATPSGMRRPGGVFLRAHT